MIITIDGPAASGKSSVAKGLAKDLSFFYLSSGMVFRAVAYVLANYLEYKKNDLTTVSELDVDQILSSKNFCYLYDNKSGDITIKFKNSDITSFLKSEQIDLYSSILGEVLAVRNSLEKFQKRLSKKHNIVVEGRDIGSAIFPEAEFKFYLTASLEERACRWQKMQEKKEKQYSLEQAKQIISERDERDTQRKIAPLCIPKGAIIIDNSNLNFDQTIQEFKKFLQSNLI